LKVEDQLKVRRLWMRPWAAAVALTLGSMTAMAQGQGAAPAAPQGRGAQPAAALSGRAGAPIEITGYWVAVISDDWRYRMQTPPKGNVDYLPVNAEARKMTDSWDPARDEANEEQCRAYGAAGVMRHPGRLNITWEGESTLRIDADAGSQTRRLRFGAVPPPSGEPTWQGHSVARWQYPPGARGRGPVPQGQLVVTTTHMRPGYLRKNGVPYSAKAVLTEYFIRLADDAGQEYLAVTQMVDDPQYLTQPYVKTYQFRKQSDASGWAPTPCSSR
jgi:hypothetical protein